MRPCLQIKRFLKAEDGTLLVFFAVCVVTILGIVALSFDMGRRASTQTDMQSFVDNVALAAAGELDGSPNAIANATAAANTVIVAANETLKSGTAGQNFTLTLNQIVFFSDLPATDGPTTFDVATLSDPTPGNDNYKYALPTPGRTADPALARFVGVRLDTEDVAWVFGNVFGSGNIPDEAVGAVAIAGNAPFVCDVQPILFCMPSGGSGGAGGLMPGQSMHLTSAAPGAVWRSGDFGFLDPASVPLDTACSRFSDQWLRRACLQNITQRISACFQPDNVDIVPGAALAPDETVFNLPFDLFAGNVSQFRNRPAYAPGPHSINGYRPSCTTNNPTGETMAFPPDDCFSSGCGPFGDGGWNGGRNAYVDTNYTVYDPPVGGAPPAERVPGSFFDFPESSLTRYEYYLREIERAANGGVMTAAGTPPYLDTEYLPDNDGGRGSTPEPEAAYTTWDDYWPDSFSGLNPIIPDAQNRAENGLPTCNTRDYGVPGPERRVVLAAGINCPSGAGAFQGNITGAKIEQFYRVFLMRPAEPNGALTDLWVEMVSPVNTAIGVTPNEGVFHEVVQLYK